MESKQVRDLMEAYASIYEKKEDPEMEEGENEEEEDEDSKKGSKMKTQKKKKEEEEDEDLEETASNPSSQLRKMRDKNFPQQKPLEENADLFDYLLEYLVAEGYADTNKAALAIMANMSEEWKQSIVEGDALRNTIKTLEGKRDAMNANKPGSANTAAPGKQSVGAATYKAYQRLRGA
jgi:DNA-directed RNA polymerase specialized sigma54-like protein